jgi:hypothetical protein
MTSPKSTGLSSELSSRRTSLYRRKDLAGENRIIYELLVDGNY